MAKIMLVEDDKNLSSIYKDRLLAEGYDIVAAHDGEEALALAVKEKPILIIADVMMPKISGFDMLDILRSTPETKNTKVIMMTALSQSEDQQRATQLGADKYLVKSQVTLDDVARVVKEVLSSIDSPVAAPSAPIAEPAASEPSTPQPEPASVPVEPSPSPEIAQNPIPETPQVPAEPAAEEKNEIEKEIENFGESLPVQAPQEVSPTPSTPQPEPASVPVEPSPSPEIAQNPIPETPELPSTPVAASEQNGPQVGEKVLTPISDTSKPDIMALYEQEMAKENGGQSANPQTSPDQQTPPFDPHNISL